MAGEDDVDMIGEAFPQDMSSLLDTVACVYISNPSHEICRAGIAISTARSRHGKDDPKFGEFILYQAPDNEYFTHTESILVRHQPAKIWIMQGGITEGEQKKLNSIAEATGANVVFANQKVSSLDAAKPDICTLLGEESLAFYGDLNNDKTFALKALSVLIQKESLLQDSTNHGAFQLSEKTVEGHMRLDNAAVRALNLLPTKKGEESLSHIWGLLSQGCWCKAGSRKLKQWLLTPLIDVKEIKSRQEVVQLFVENTQLREEMKEKMRIPDLDSLNARLHRRYASLTDMLRLYHFVQLLPNVVDTIKRNIGSNPEEESSSATGPDILYERCTKHLEWAQEEFGKLCQLIEKIVDDVNAPEPRINPDWDDDLKQIAMKLKDIEGKVADEADKVMNGWGAQLDIKCEKDKQRGFVFRAAKKHDKTIRKQAAVTVCTVLKDGIYFTTEGKNGLHRLGKDFRDLTAEYEDKQRALIKDAVDIVRTYSPVIEAVSSTIAELDALQAMAHLSIFAPVPYIRPTVFGLGEGDICLKQARHPVMEVQENTNFIANDYDLCRKRMQSEVASPSGNDFKSSKPSHFQLITGPNMGGKSTYIRQLGTISILAQIGCFVPADSASLPVMDCILARVGAGDSQLRGVSTFMAEMLEASCILRTATENSLVIIDELGRGTSTYDGFGLAWAISEHLAKNTRCFTLFATHFHELTSLEDCVQGVKNRHVTAHTDTGTITMLYNVREGACPSSFGIHVAELASFPKDVIEDAKSKADELECISAQGRALLSSGKVSKRSKFNNDIALKFAQSLAALPGDMKQAKEGTLSTANIRTAISQFLKEHKEEIVSQMNN